MEGAELLRCHTSQIALHCAFYDQIGDDRLLGEYRRLLSGTERAQEARFHFPDDRRRYLVTRVLVRTTLSRHVDGSVRPEQWTFAPGRYGRPEITNRQVDAGKLSFNVSHTKGLIILGIAIDRALGVDTENVRRDHVPLGAAERYFAADEVDALRSLPPDEQPQRFFEYWTLKESYIKARGMGLTIPLDHFAFEFVAPGGRVLLSVDPRQADRSTRWQFSQFWLKNDHLAAVCSERSLQETQRLVVTETVPLVGETPLDYKLIRASE